MGAHSCPNGRTPGKHRGEPAPLFDIDLDLARLGVSAGAMVAAAGTVVALAPAAGAAAARPTAATRRAATSNDFARLRGCESGDNYGIDTGNGYYGAYQFNLGTWRGLGYSGLPNQAAPAVQDQAAERLQAARGWEPWPSCSARLGLNADSGPFVGAAATSPTVLSAPAAATGPDIDSSTGVPHFDGTTLDVSLLYTRRADVATWQQRMAQRGWRIAIDGYFGPQSSRVAAAFTAEKGINDVLPGRVNSDVWTGAWTLPVTP